MNTATTNTSIVLYRTHGLLTSLSSAEAAELAVSIGKGVLVGVPGTGVLLCESTAVISDPPYRCPPGHSPRSIQWHMFSSRWNITRSYEMTIIQFHDHDKPQLSKTENNNETFTTLPTAVISKNQKTPQRPKLANRSLPKVAKNWGNTNSI